MSVTCKEVREHMAWLLDEELDPVQAMLMQAHIEHCFECATVCREQRQERVGVKEAVDQVAVPADFLQRMETVVWEAGTARERKPKIKRKIPWFSDLGWLGTIGFGRFHFGISFVLVCFVLGLVVWQSTLDQRGPSWESLLRWHRREIPMDVASADIGKLQQYFRGKVPFALNLPPQQGWTEPTHLGGRIAEYEKGEVALVRYTMPGGRLSLVVYDSPARGISEEFLGRIGWSSEGSIEQRSGFRIARWYRGGVGYALISDVSQRKFDSVRSFLSRRHP